jgi:signal transduction histidine kinase
MERSVDRKAHTFEEGQRLILERAAGGVPLRDLLEDITLLIERQRPGHMMCSLLLVDRAHGCVRHGAAPSLPVEFVRRIDGSSIGPQAGSCGTAAYLGERVIVEDIATHPAWVDYRAFALPHGLRAGARATALVRQILTFSSDQAPKRELVNLPAIVEESLRLVRATAPRTIEFDTLIAPDVPAILAESTQVHQVIMNLCTNATHAIGDGAGRVCLRVERAQLERGLIDSTVELLPGTYARLVVEDTGAGMSDATLERIFDPFFTTKEAGKGTGLGLAVVHGIMKSHQGGIVVRTTPGVGTTFTLYLSLGRAAGRRSPSCAFRRSGCTGRAARSARRGAPPFGYEHRPRRRR